MPRFLSKFQSTCFLTFYTLLPFFFSLPTNATTQLDCDILVTEAGASARNAESIDWQGVWHVLSTECEGLIEDKVLVELFTKLTDNVSYPELPSHRSAKANALKKTLHSSFTLATQFNSNVDTSPPVLVSLSISPQTVDVTSGEQAVSVVVSLKDASGIGSANFWFRRPEFGLFKRKTSSSGWVYNSQTENYDNTFTFVFDETSVAGTWEFSSLHITDSIGNRSSGYDSSAEISALGFNPYLTILNGVNSITFDSKITPRTDYSNITLNQTSELTLTIEDSKSYTLTVLANADNNLTNVDFVGASSIARSCTITAAKIACDFSAVVGANALVLSVTSSSAELSDYGISINLVPDSGAVELDWANNFINFPEVDIDGDNIVNAIDDDDDGDGFLDSVDLFPFDNAESLDTDGDGVGNNADTDDDNDGVLDTADAFATNVAASVDTDLDGLPDSFNENCNETCVAASGLTLDLDDDGDQYLDADELAAGTDPLNSTSVPLDTDGDFISNVTDTDDDNDGVLDTADAYPLVTIDGYVDTDNDGAPDECDAACLSLGMTADNDDDNDGITDAEDAYPLIAIGDYVDTDNDGAPDECNAACISLGMTADTDDDNDGFEDSVDAYPLDLSRNSKITYLAGNGVNIDGIADVLWRNMKDGRVYLRLMDGLEQLNGKVVGEASLDWLIVGKGDFNGDNESDILWRNTRTGLNYVWMMDGDTVTEGKAINTVADLDWQIKAVADFNGDGKSDILWHHQVRGDTHIYLMDGVQVIGRSSVKKITNFEWQIEATTDLNGDGKSDVIWRQQSTGLNYIWLMDGYTIQKRYPLNTISTEWDLVGAGDLNGDGYGDIVWRNPIDGRNWAYLMKDGQIETSQQINNVKGAEWQIKSVADFNGDGKADIFWHNQSTGLTYVYLMEGAAIISRGALNTVNPQWQVIGK